MSITLTAILVLVALVLLWLVATYNKLIRGRNRVDESWSDIDVQLKRRHDLILNLVNTVKGYAKHEEGVFTKVTEARAAALGAKSPKEQAQAENILSGTLKTLFAVAENYPQLKANENFLDLQRNLTDTEDKIQASRRFYNGNVRDFNTCLQVFPTNLVTEMLNFKAREFYEVADEAERNNPNVQF